ncbi:MAG: PhoH family protein [Gammaproteobacteria bacterium]|nr:PhoH family protein [Gammaproteobacteria bacterium]
MAVTKALGIDHTAFAEGLEVRLDPADNARLALLCGQFDEHLHLIERTLNVQLHRRGHVFHILGERGAAQIARAVLLRLYRDTQTAPPTLAEAQLVLREHQIDAAAAETHTEDEGGRVLIRRGVVQGRGHKQRAYIQNIRSHDISFGIGPAGTGKTYLAVASAVEALEKERVRRLVLTRPAVEAGERLGFLPGDMAQKIDPYLRPLYDALYEMLGFDQVARLIERHVIEIAPLAFMRGRTLNESFIILDEAQNTTPEQMKMFLTRIGFGSKVVITGDVTQTDLPAHKTSGLRHATQVLQDVEGIAFSFFSAHDVVRHPLVQRVVTAYERVEAAAQETV